MNILDTIAACTVEPGEVISHPEINEGETVVVTDRDDTALNTVLSWRDFTWMDEKGETEISPDEVVNYHGIA